MNERKKLIMSIHKNINNCTIEDKKIILFKIISSGISLKKIFEEGTGTRIFYKYLNTGLLVELNKYILEASEKNIINLDSSDED